MNDSADKLIFVYNADSGLFNTATDIAHKILSPQTYSCDLCALTHGHFKIRREWVAFLEELPVETEFLHRDEYIKQHGEPEVEFPVIFIDTGKGHEPLLKREEIAECDNLDALREKLRSRLETDASAR